MGLGFNVLLLSAVSFLTDVSSEIIFPLLPLFIISAEAGGLGLGTAFGLLLVGFIEGVREALASILKVFSGHLSDRLGRRKRLVVGGYGISGLVKLGFPFVAAWDALVGLAVAERVGKGFRDAPRDAILADSGPPEVRGMVFGFHRTADTLGAATGPLIALLLFAPLGFRGVFLVATIPAVLSAVLVLFVRERRKDPGRTPSLRVSLSALRPELKYFLLVATIFTAGNFSVFFLLVRVAWGSPEGFVLAVQQALLLYLAFNVTYASTAIPAGLLSDRKGRIKPILLGYGLFAAVALGFIAVPSDPWFYLPLFVLFGTSYGMVEGVQRALVADLSQAHLRATSLGTYHTLTGLAKFPGSFVFGALWAFLGPSASFAYATATAVAAFLLLLAVAGRFPTPARGPVRIPPG
jgi:MFS family permease